MLKLSYAIFKMNKIPLFHHLVQGIKRNVQELSLFIFPVYSIKNTNLQGYIFCILPPPTVGGEFIFRNRGWEGKNWLETIK